MVRLLAALWLVSGCVGYLGLARQLGRAPRTRDVLALWARALSLRPCD